MIALRECKNEIERNENFPLLCLLASSIEAIEENPFVIAAKTLAIINCSNKEERITYNNTYNNSLLLYAYSVEAIGGNPAGVLNEILWIIDKRKEEREN